MMKRLIAMMECAVLAGMLVCVSPFVSQEPAEAQWQVPNYSVPVGRGAGTGFKSVGPCNSSSLVTWSSTSVDPACSAIIPFTPVVSPVGAGASGHVLPWLDENWTHSADTYTLQSSDPHILPASAVLSGSAAATFTIRFQWGANDISISSSVGGTLTAVAADLIAQANANATISAAGFNFQQSTATILIAPSYSASPVTITSTGAGTITVSGSPTQNILDVNPIIAMTRSVVGRAAQANDTVGALYFYGQDSTGVAANVSYGSITGVIGSPTTGSHAGLLYFQTSQSASNQVRWAIGNGLYAFLNASAITGGDLGAGYANVKGLHTQDGNITVNQSAAASPAAVTLLHTDTNHSFEIYMYGASQAGGERGALIGGGVEALTVSTDGAGAVTLKQGLLTVGVTGSVSGNVSIAGGTSGIISIIGDTGTYNFHLPSSAGTTGQPLLSGGGAAAQTYGTLGPAGGGTGFASYTIGDMLYATGATTLGKLTAVATGNALISGGVATAPLWGKIGLTTHVSGVLPGVNGGTGLSTAAIGDIIYADATTPTWARLAGVATGSLLASGGINTAPAWSASPTLTTSLTVPLVIGGTAASSSLILESTSGAGTSDSIQFKTGSQLTRWTVTTDGVLNQSLAQTDANKLGISITNTKVGGYSSKVTLANDVRSFSFFVTGASSGVDSGGVFAVYDNTTSGGAGYRLYISSTGKVGLGPQAYETTHDLGMSGIAARTWALERNSTAATAGQGLTIDAGGAIAGTADLAGGNLTLNSGISTGTGTSQILLRVALVGTTGTSDNTITTAYSIDESLHLRSHGTAPALTSCGTTPAIEGTDMSGTVTMGTGSPTGCVITFNKAYASAPRCAVTWRATPLASQSYTVSNTAITLTQTGTSSNLVDYFCVSRSTGWLLKRDLDPAANDNTPAFMENAA